MQILLFVCIIIFFLHFVIIWVTHSITKPSPTWESWEKPPEPLFLVKVSTKNQSKLECSTHWEITWALWPIRNYGYPWPCTDSLSTAWPWREAATGTPDSPEERQCTQQEVEAELHFLTTCQLYQHQRQLLSTDYNIPKRLRQPGY